jgi:hypothetical protein
MSTPYIPTKDNEFSVWSANFALVLSTAYAAYGLAASDATAISAADATWQAAYAVATTEATRTKVTVAAKDLARNQCKALERGYANVIQANSGITQDQKADLGLTIRDTTKSPIPAPTTSPILTIVGATPGQLTVRYADQNTPSARKKPVGAIALQLFAATSATVISDPSTLPLKASVTRNPVGLDFVSGDAGKTAYIAGRWITRRGLVGPWSAIATYIVV